MSIHPGALLAAVLGVALLPGCKREYISDVPTLGASTCMVRLDDQRSNVLLRCGSPCGGGEVAPDLRCDVYVSSEICYRDGRVASLERLPPFNGRFAWCNWAQEPSEAPEVSETPEAPAPDAGDATTP